MRFALRILFATAALGALASVPARAGTYPFEGTWNCEVAVFSFTATTYNNGSATAPTC